MNKTNSLVIIFFLFMACSQLKQAPIQTAAIPRTSLNSKQVSTELEKKLNSIDQKLEQIVTEQEVEEQTTEQQLAIQQVTPSEIPRQEIISKQVIPAPVTNEQDNERETEEQISTKEEEVINSITEQNLESAKIDSDPKQNQLEANAAIALSQFIALEVVWAVPKNPVDIFIIDYGFNASNLNKRLKIRADTLENKQGFYCYKLVEIPKDQAVYFTIQSISKLGRSEKSAVHVVRPSY